MAAENQYFFRARPIFAELDPSTDGQNKGRLALNF
jgi:hypothetical protein